MKKVLGICLSLLLLFGMSSCTQQGAKKDTESAPGKIDKIEYTEARKYMGKHATVCGSVVGNSDIGAQILLHFGVPLSDPKVVGLEVNKKDRDKFPDDYMKDVEICVTGKIHRNPAGGASMSLNDMSQITMRDGSPFGAVEKKPQYPTITYDEGILYVWTTAAICGKIVDKTNSADEVILGMGEPVAAPGAFDVVISSADISKFPGDLYVGKDVCIIGRVIGNPDGSAGVKLEKSDQVEMK